MGAASNRPVNILHLEDDARDVELVRDRLQQCHVAHDLHHAGGRREFEAAIDKMRFDLILSDYSLPDYDGLAALALAREKQLHVPFIMISGQLGEEKALECIRSGATDYVPKYRLDWLATAVVRALAEAEERQKRQDAEEGMRKSARQANAMFEQAAVGIAMVSLDGRWLRVNRRLSEMVGYSVDGFRKLRFGDITHPDDVTEDADTLRAMVAGERGSCSREKRFFRKDGELIWIKVTASLVRDEAGQPDYFVSFYEEITAQKRAAEERAKLEEQLRVSQKMEAIGVLAGGVAHDFNNLLTVIMSYTEFALVGVRDGDPLMGDLLEVQAAGARATVLTRQLLAFSRKQVLQPVALCLNDSAAAVEKMLKRILGEDIELILALAPDLGLTLADPSQVEQVLMNLVVNARDAMPAGGTLTIATANMEMDANQAAREHAMKRGAYVELTVADTGCGMDEQTRTRIFEPFFTTKEVGKGTGLGLSTVYGIVKQSGGDIMVSSELDRGTTFTVLLPRDLSATMATATVPATVPGLAKGTETILVVEDEEALRKVAQRTLAAAGYQVLAAADGVEALLLSVQHAGVIDLLLTDVVMPRMGGRVLAQRLLQARVALKVLYMSGYTDDTIAHHGALEAGTWFLAKPFTAAALARKVRDVLDEGTDRVANGHDPYH